VHGSFEILIEVVNREEEKDREECLQLGRLYRAIRSGEGRYERECGNWIWNFEGS
jgi:hypothetical protein